MLAARRDPPEADGVLALLYRCAGQDLREHLAGQFVMDPPALADPFLYSNQDLDLRLTHGTWSAFHPHHPLFLSTDPARR